MKGKWGWGERPIGRPRTNHPESEKERRRARRVYFREYMRRRRGSVREHERPTEIGPKPESAPFNLRLIELEDSRDFTSVLMGDPPPGRREMLARIP